MIVLLMCFTTVSTDLDMWLISKGLFSSVSILLAIITVSTNVFTSWSAIWIVFGADSWLGRILKTMLIYHLAMASSLISVWSILWFQGEDFGDEWYLDFIAFFTGFSYGFACHLAGYMFLLWFLKLARFRLLYYQNAATYPHPRRVTRETPIDSREGIVLLKGSVRLIDLFGLTTLVGLYLGGIYPLQVVLQNDRMFGPMFAFAIAFYLTIISGGIGLVAFLAPTTLGLLDRRGVRFQIIVQTILFGVTSIAAAIWISYYPTDDDVIAFSILGVSGMLVFQLTLAGLLRKPTNRLRFRIVRNA